MSATIEQKFEELRRAYEELQKQHDAALAELQAHPAAPAQQNNGELAVHIGRVAHQDTGSLSAENEELRAAQAAGLEVLQAMVASPGDTQPVFDLIAQRAAKLCDVPHAVFAKFDGTLIHLVTHTGMDPATAEVLLRQFPRPPGQDIALGRAILNGRIEQIEDITDPSRRFTPPPGQRSVLAVPLLRDGVPLGAIAIGRPTPGPFPKNQVTLLQTFAEQAVIAISSAETYRALQERTAALAQRNSEYGERIEQQAATIDVLKAMSASPGDAQPVFELIVQYARDRCNGMSVGLFEYDGNLVYIRADSGGDTAATRRFAAMFPVAPTRESLACRAILDRHIVHIKDMDTEPGLFQAVLDMGAKTTLSVPLLRDGIAIGALSLNSKESGGFTDSQVALLQTFAEQAVIAVTSAESYRALHEALEHQTATAEVLEVINASPGDLKPVFDAILEKAHSLCGATRGAFIIFDGDQSQVATTRGLSERYVQILREQHQNPAQSPAGPREQLLNGANFVQRSGPVILTGPIGRAGAELENVHAVLFVPLRQDSRLLGYITAYREQQSLFADKQISVLQNFAAQAVVAMENARLINETRETLDQQTATTEVLQIINASPGNLKPVFDAVLEKALRLCAASFGTLLTVDGERLERVALLGVPAAFAEWGRQNPLTRDTALIARGFHTRKPVQAVDVVTDPFLADTPSVRDALVDLGGVRALLQVPLLKDEIVQGFIVVFRREPGAFPEKQVALLEGFAAQAVIAMDNARLLTEQREALEQQTATAEVLQVINASPGDLAPVFDAILEKAHNLCGAEIGALLTYDGNAVRLAAERNLPPAWADVVRGPWLPRHDHPVARMIGGERLFQIEDMAKIARTSDDPMLHAAIELGGIRSLLLVPLRKDGVFLGYITAYRQEVRPFTEKQIALLENFAAQAVIAMENARLINETREALEQQTATAEVLRVINASPGNLTPVFDTILEKAHTLCGAAIGALMMHDGGGRFHAVATHGFPEHHAALIRQGVDGGPPHRALMAGERVVHLDDRRALAEPKDNPGSRSVVETGVRTGLWVPLRKDNLLLGCISALRPEVRPFSDKEIILLESFAAQAVIAIENARLLNEIRQRQEELRITFENMGDGVAMFDGTQHLLAWNGKFQEIFYLPGDLLKQHPTYEEYLRFLADRGDFGMGVDTTERIHQLVANTDQSYGYERTRPDGRVIEIRRNPVPDGGFVLIFSDITERKRSEEEIRAARDAAEAAYRDLKAAQASLIQAEKMASLGQLTAGIAHEIKNPLNFVNNFATLSVDLLDELKQTAAPGLAMLDDARRAEVEDLASTLAGNLGKINEHGRRADGIVRSMLEHSRGNSGERRSVDLNSLVEEALNLAYHGARAQDQSFNITLQRELGDGIAPIMLAPQDVTRVLLNLFSNGFYAARERQRTISGFEPSLKVSTRQLDDAVEIRVRDNGIGIPTEIRDRLFQPFFTTKPPGEGTGLGLSMSYDIITQQHGGSISVDSKAGEYSEFTIRLPRNA